MSSDDALVALAAAKQPENAATPAERAAEDLERGMRFNHVLEMETRQRLTEVAASVYALAETLIAEGAIPLEEYEKRRTAALQREVKRARSGALVVINNEVPDKYALKDLPQIDCEARLPLCKARCCTFTFPLSAQDLDERVVRWDYGRPYQIARQKDGYCVHNGSEARTCTVYANRPAVCRTYDCRTDKRVWLDFENRIPAA